MTFSLATKDKDLDGFAEPANKTMETVKEVSTSPESGDPPPQAEDAPDPDEDDLDDLDGESHLGLGLPAD